MKTILLILIVILVMLPCSDKAEQLISNMFNNIFKGKIPGHKILPILKLTLSIIMLFLGYSILTNICLVVIIVQNLIILKKY